jgi:phosphatidate cytidylyltransferase
MTREESWHVEGMTLGLPRQITSLGYTVSVHRLPSSLLNRSGAFSAAVSDSAQYYCGRAFGRRKLAPAVSPAKTIEGAVGGVIVAALVGALTGPWCVPGVSALGAFALTLALALAGILGDLFESLIKRSAGVKDSSNLIPGHGGVLDRIDSHLFAAPVFFAFLRYFA